jgi:hypothetical protein
MNRDYISGTVGWRIELCDEGKLINVRAGKINMGRVNDPS